MGESEKVLEAKLRKAIELRGGIALKLSSQLHRGLPDRMVLMPHAMIYFVEMKSSGKRPTALQRLCHDWLRKLGYFVAIIDSSEALDNFLYVVDWEQTEIRKK